MIRNLALASLLAFGNQKGTSYSAIPAVINGKAVVMVSFGTPDGKMHSTDVELR